MVDQGTGPVSLSWVWGALVHRLAVVAGCLAALTSLALHVPVWIACGRGAVAWAAVLVVGRAGAWLLARTADPAAPADPAEAGGEPVETSR